MSGPRDPRHPRPEDKTVEVPLRSPQSPGPPAEEPWWKNANTRVPPPPMPAPPRAPGATTGGPEAAATAGPAPGSTGTNPGQESSREGDAPPEPRAGRTVERRRRHRDNRRCSRADGRAVEIRCAERQSARRVQGRGGRAAGPAGSRSRIQRDERVRCRMQRRQETRRSRKAPRSPARWSSKAGNETCSWCSRTTTAPTRWTDLDSLRPKTAAGTVIHCGKPKSATTPWSRPAV